MYKNDLFSVREGASNILYNQKKKTLTQERLAKICGVSRQTIWSIEAERSMPSYPLAMKIYSVLKKIDPSIKIDKLFPISS